MTRLGGRVRAALAGMGLLAGALGAQVPAQAPVPPTAWPAPPTYPPDVTFAPAPGPRESWAHAGCCRVGLRLTAVSLVAGQRAFVSFVLELAGPDGLPAHFPPTRPGGSPEVEVYLDVRFRHEGREVGRQVVMCMGAGPGDLMVALGGLPPGLPPEGSYSITAEVWLADPGTRGQSPLADDTPDDDRDQVVLVYPEGTLSRPGSPGAEAAGEEP